MSEVQVLIRLTFAIVIGFFIGLEREKQHRPAGIKTHILVCVGAAVISMIQLQMMENVIKRVLEDPSLKDILGSDPARLPAQVISGIGFLGAGTILRTKGSVKGLTTAATLWLSACLGIGIGMGYYIVTGGAFILVMILLFVLKIFQENILGKKGIYDLEIYMVNKKEAMEELNGNMSSRFINIKNIDFPDEQEESYHYGLPVIRCNYRISLPKEVEIQNVLNEINMQKNIVKASIATN